MTDVRVDGPPRERLFRQLVQDHRQRLHRFILKNIGHAYDAEDLVQQVFLEASRSYETYRGESALSTWLYGIAMNLTRNYLSRAPQRKYDFVDSELLEDIAAESDDPADSIARRRAVISLNRELSALPLEMREVLLLVALEETSYEEAALMLAIPVGTVRSRVARARARLRERLGDVGILP
ncbi:RNA polymerase sigma-70 factor, ECF subfamily [Propionivibrio dicarboxylicus]|uniref:RNA polymerase sigma-70 factor, ECF subfamily n=2 Tax=Propionivibrio dicarboxylicus TaxID=83767 RepID=A0A1G7WU60_9RHOO|nr:RNA polymerase sigma-70 factor, ECF subfamily [Propionivibrio dicarboxylicus]